MLQAASLTANRDTTQLRRLLLIALLALLIRFAFMPFTMHIHEAFTGDLIAMNYHAHALTTNDDDAVPDASLYPPLAYLAMAAWQRLLGPLLGPSLGRHPILGPEALPTWLADPYLFRQLFWLKAAYLPFDLGAAVLLYRLAGDRRAGLSLYTFWLFNPLVIFTGYIHGQFDIIPVFFTILSLYNLKREQLGQAAFWMGISACFKNYALFLLPLIVLRGRSWRQQVALLLVGTLPYILLLVTAPGPNTLATLEYRQNLFPLNLELRFGQVILIFVVVFVFILWHVHQRQLLHFDALWRWMAIILLLYLAQAVFNHHYLLWVVPFAGLAWLSDRSLSWPYLALLFCSLLFLLREPAGQYLMPLAPELFQRAPSAAELLSPYLPLAWLVDFARSAFVGTLLWITYRLYRQIQP